MAPHLHLDRQRSRDRPSQRWQLLRRTNRSGRDFCSAGPSQLESGCRQGGSRSACTGVSGPAAAACGGRCPGSGRVGHGCPGRQRARSSAVHRRRGVQFDSPRQLGRARAAGPAVPATVLAQQRGAAAVATAALQSLRRCRPPGCGQAIAMQLVDHRSQVFLLVDMELIHHDGVAHGCRQSGESGLPVAFIGRTVPTPGPERPQHRQSQSPMSGCRHDAVAIASARAEVTNPGPQADGAKNRDAAAPRVRRLPSAAGLETRRRDRSRCGLRKKRLIAVAMPPSRERQVHRGEPPSAAKRAAARELHIKRTPAGAGPRGACRTRAQRPHRQAGVSVREEQQRAAACCRTGIPSGRARPVVPATSAKALAVRIPARRAIAAAAVDHDQLRPAPALEAVPGGGPNSSRPASFSTG